MTDQDANDELLKRALNGERNAIGELLVSFDDRLRSYVRRVARTRDDDFIEEIVQETYTKAYRAIRQFTPRGPNSLLAWLKTIAKNTFQSEVRKPARTRRVSASRLRGARRGTSRTWSSNDLDCVARNTSMSRIVARKETRNVIQAALDTLPKVWQDVLRLRLVDDLSIKEIAVRMGATEGRVRGLLRSARHRLKESLATLYLESGK